MKKIIGMFMLLVSSCNQSTESLQAIQPQELVGTWKATRTHVSSCISNGTTLAPDTGIDESTYAIFGDSIKICIKEILRSPCGPIPLPHCFPPAKQWYFVNDTLFVFLAEESAGIAADTAKYVLSRYAAGMIIFSSGSTIDTCSRL